MKDFHQPVMIDEVIKYLEPKTGDDFIDCNLGGAGHSEEILKKVSPKGRVLGIDLDPIAIKKAEEVTRKYKGQIILVKENFENLKKIADEHNFNKVRGILFDLGLSSAQLQDQLRGFSFSAEGSLDMRFDPKSKTTAEEILNQYSQKDLYEIFKNFGEEKLADPISKKIIEIRRLNSITSPKQLAEIVVEVYRKYYRGKSKTNPATKVFQALRIAVNQELESLQKVLPQTVDLLDQGGHLVIMSYHSLEDKIVKEFFKKESRDCICPTEIPICQCKHKKTLKIITKKPVMASSKEIMNNPRARSAKMRVAERV